MMKIIATAAILTLGAGAALAQSPPPTGAPTTTPPAATAPAVTLEPAVEARFKGLDKNANGSLDGAEVTTFKADIAKIDTDKDGKISRAEFASALKAGVIK